MSGPERLPVEGLAHWAAAGIEPSVLLSTLRPRVTVAEIARAADVSYFTAWQIANLRRPATGPKSRAVQQHIDKALGISYPWRNDG